MSETKHAKFSASGSERWLNCPGSVRLSEKAPPQGSNPYADEGTRAHAALEQILRAYIDGQKPYTVAFLLEKEFGKEMVGHALEAFKFLEASHAASAEGSEILSEVRVDLPVSYPGQFGTVDAAIVEPFGVLTVFDYKYGAGYWVGAQDNSQLLYYAVGLADLFAWNFTAIDLVIFQPRMPDPDSKAAFPGSKHRMTVEELRAWRDKFEAGIQAALKPNAPLCAGDWCRWCPAKTICPEISENALRQARVEFEPVSTSFNAPAPALIPDLGRTLLLFDRLETWMESVREYAHRQLESGAKVEGWKIVQKRSTRKWIDAEKAAKEAKREFGASAFTEPELKSPAQLEKTGVDSAWIEKRVSAISSGTTLVPEGDSRSAVQPMTQEFDAVPTARGAARIENKSATKKTKGKQTNGTNEL